ncbi:Tyrosine-sulfated glycopeptide receptor 1 [Perkinsela sp. CCAP 1560/4]|nr:Tyrosine-sulfated glycopeptide receptor 1 [Perkinsela sp. CCAP 1560/4]|eukprot:KNH06432.1 Tyrosine-sulfated glycopeptide receptor 1 [Perkinsela sp. CCAP 1560/4]
MFTAAFIECADNCIGRFDRSTLPQQTLMELFIFGLDEVNGICGNRDNLTEVCTWKGVTCNADWEVEIFKWSNTYPDGTGTVSLEFLPYSMRKLNMLCNSLSGGRWCSG